MENTVYLVLEEVEYDGFSIVSIHRSEAIAIKKAEELGTQGKYEKLSDHIWRKRDQWVTVEAIELQD